MTHSPIPLLEEIKRLDEEANKWWIDDVTNRVCAPLNHPKLGLETLPWPDYEKVHVVIDKAAFDKIAKALERALEALAQVKAETGSSTLSWKISSDAITEIREMLGGC